MIEFHILGGTTLRREDNHFDQSFLKGPKRVALLTYLLLDRPREFHRRDELVALFWPEMGQKSARNALSNMLYHIREALGKYVLESRGTEEIRLDPEKIWCDAVAFEEGLDEEAAEKALELYHGDLLPGFHVTNISNEFQSWLDGERERLRKRAFEAARTLTEKAEEQRDLAMARRWAKKAAALMPFSEEAQVHLITILKQMGDRAGALRAYKAFEERLRTEWEMEPSGKLKALAEDINRQPPDEAAPSSESSQKDARGPATLVTAPRDRSPSSSELSVATKTDEKDQESASYRWWAAAAGLLILVLTAGWIFWPGSADDAAPAVAERSVAVLPFTYLGAEDSTDYFSLGMTEEILSRLAQVSDLSVISRTSVMQYQNTQKSLREIAGELGVAAIVEGSVQQAAGRVRIHAQLIDAETDHHLWSKSYDREHKNIFAVQSDIAKAIATELKAELAPGVEERIQRVPTKDLVAYELYLRSRQHYNRSTKKANNAAIKLLRQALKRDPDFALARVALAAAYAKDVWNFGGGTQRSDSAVAEAERAISLEPDLGDAHAALGSARMSAGRFSEAGSAFEKALELNPNDWGVVNAIATVNLKTGRIAQAIGNLKQVLKGDPARAHGWRSNLAFAYRTLGLFDRAERENRASIILQPDFIYPKINQAHIELIRGDTTAALNTVEPLISEEESNPYALLGGGWIFILAGQPERAREPLERAYELSPAASGEGYLRVRLGYALWQTGERERAVKLFEEFERFAAGQLEKGNEYGLLPYSLAEVHAVRGEKDMALRWFERAVVEAGWPFELSTIHDPMLASLRDEARFQTLVDRMSKRNEENRQQLARDEGLERIDLLQTEKRVQN